MVEADIQILGGVAVTVFLALMFFGVVVLWDVALALRSVGDKIDKLEDNIDDDLKDIGHSLDGMSSATGGGTQLHLSGGGTISPGPGTESHPRHGPQRATQQPSHPADSSDRSVDGHQQGAPQQSPRPPHQPATHVSHPGQPGYDGDVRESDRRSVAGESPPGDETTDQREDASVNEETADRTAEATDRGPARPNDSEDELGAPHPRAAVNRGRFVTSPDRTPWYATPLDREAIASALSPIVGELEAAPPGSTDDADDGGDGDGGDGEVDEIDDGGVDSHGSTPIEAGPVPTDEEPIAVGPGGIDAESAPTDVDETESADGDDEIDSSDADEETGSTDVDDETVSADEAESGGATTDAGSTPGGDSSELGSTLDGVGDDDSPEDDGAESDESAVEPEDRAGVVTEFEAETASAAEDATERARDGSSDESVEDEDGDTANDVEGSRILADESPDDVDASDDTDDAEASDDTDDSSNDTSDDVDSPDEGNSAADSDRETPDGSEGSDADDSVDETFTDFSFDEATDDGADEGSVTLEEAVETANDEEPALSRSSHGVETSAESDEDGVVLVFTFDPETVDAGESTKRLLRYQLRSFADRSSTPDGDVTVEGNRIVIEIPDADGNAVSRWRDAAVQVIDRTMYLSDNSE